MKLVLLFFNLLSTSSLSNLYCNSPCTSCSQGYTYESKSCLDLCPTKYTTTEANKSCTASSDLVLMLVDFLRFYKFHSKTIEDFTTLNNLYFDETLDAPVPVLGMGFYFKTSSYLISQNYWIPAPDMSIRLLFKDLTGNGDILKISNTALDVFRIYINDFKVYGEWYLTKASGVVYKNNFASINTEWQKLSFLCSQNEGTVSLYVTGESALTTLGEFRGQLSDLKITLGGFNGFLNLLIFENNDIIRYNANTLDYSFSEGYSLSGTRCTDTGCGWPWCVNEGNCNLNFWSTCTEFTGYQITDCTVCSSSTAPYCGLKYKCTLGTYETCTECHPDFTLISGYCTYQPTNYDQSAIDSPVFDLTFNIFEQNPGSLFQSGANELTFSPFDNPEADDPIYLKNRGLYFKGSQYLVTKNIFRMNYEFSIVAWARSQQNCCLLSSKNFEVDGYFTPSIKLVGDAYDFKIKARYKTFYPHDRWYFFGVSVLYSGHNFYMKTYLYEYLFDIYTLEGFQYIPAIDDKLYLGTNLLGTYWTGYIYKLTLWHKGFSSLLTYANLCGTAYSTSCLWDCASNIYYNTFLKTYLSCDSSCEACSTFGTCNICKNSDCTSCSGFGIDCIKTASNPCLLDLSLSPSGNCCKSPCLDCFLENNYSCLSCNPGYYLLGQLCVVQCPLGYIIEGETCNLYSNLALDLDFNVINSSIYDKINSIEFSSGSYMGSNYKPLPAMARGFYFNGLSYFISQEILLSYEITFEIWFRLSQYGKIISKSSIEFSFDYNPRVDLIGILSTNFEFISTGLWTYIVYSFETRDFTTLYYKYQSASYLKNSSISDRIFIDSLSALKIGSDSGDFLGFIYLLRIFNSFSSYELTEFTECTSAINQNCLWSCSINQYFDGTEYKTCDSECLNGCRRIENCDLCELDICSECIYYTDSCTDCSGNYEYKNGACVCQAGFYYDEASLSCITCHEKCATCSGPGNNCLVCSSNYSKKSDGSCSCSSNEYEITPTCYPCYSLCETCDGPSSSDCLSCISTFSIYSNQCKCDSGFYQNSSICLECQSPCKTCLNESYCLSCISPFHYSQNQCSCPEGLYESNSSCFECKSNCKSCLSETICTSCNNNFQLINDSCICPDNHTQSSSNCDPCNYYCLSCSVTPDNCTSCFEPLVLDQGTCNCPESFELVNETCVQEQEIVSDDENLCLVGGGSEGCEQCLEYSIENKKSSAAENWICKKTLRDENYYCRCRFYDELFMRFENLEGMNVKIVFSDELVKELTEKDFVVKYGEKLVEFKLKVVSNSEYLIYLYFDESFESSLKLNLVFLKKVLSKLQVKETSNDLYL